MSASSFRAGSAQRACRAVPSSPTWPGPVPPPFPFQRAEAWDKGRRPRRQKPSLRSLLCDLAPSDTEQEVLHP